MSPSSPNEQALARGFTALVEDHLSWYILLNVKGPINMYQNGVSTDTSFQGAPLSSQQARLWVSTFWWWIRSPLWQRHHEAFRRCTKVPYRRSRTDREIFFCRFSTNMWRNPRLIWCSSSKESGRSESDYDFLAILPHGPEMYFLSAIGRIGRRRAVRWTWTLTTKRSDRLGGKLSKLLHIFDFTCFNIFLW